MSMTTAQMGDLTRGEVWSAQLKQILEDNLMGMSYVNWMSDFPDGDTFKIPSLGQAEVDDYREDEQAVYRPMDTGQFEFQITEYKQSGHYITKKAMQDSFYSNLLVSSFIPKQERALMEDLEGNIFDLHTKQTTGNLNKINNANHRFVGTGASNGLSLEDFSYANYALDKANVPSQGRVAIVDPSVGHQFNTLTNLVNVSNNARWEGIIADGITSDMKFVKNIYGIDVYTTNRLSTVTSETIDGTTITGTTANPAVANMFFSTQSDVLPFVGAWRQMPEVDEEYNKDFQRYEYLTTARYGLGLLYPENLVTVLANVNV